jgi:hypothetical protein
MARLPQDPSMPAALAGSTDPAQLSALFIERAANICFGFSLRGLKWPGIAASNPASPMRRLPPLPLNCFLVPEPHCERPCTNSRIFARIHAAPAVRNTNVSAKGTANRITHTNGSPHSWPIFWKFAHGNSASFKPISQDRNGPLHCIQGIGQCRRSSKPLIFLGLIFRAPMIVQFGVLTNTVFTLIFLERPTHKQMPAAGSAR